MNLSQLNTNKVLNGNTNVTAITVASQLEECLKNLEQAHGKWIKINSHEKSTSAVNFDYT